MRPCQPRFFLSIKDFDLVSSITLTRQLRLALRFVYTLTIFTPLNVPQFPPRHFSLPPTIDALNGYLGHGPSPWPDKNRWRAFFSPAYFHM